MKILVGCEESQEVTIQLRALGHEAYSCDLQPCSGGHPEWHIQGDVFDAIATKDWGMGIFFPDCTYLTVTANKWYKDQPPRKSGTLVGQARRDAREEAVAFFTKLYNCGIPKIAIENPIGVMSTRLRKPDQIIQPWQHGHKETKSTCLWLKGLPKIEPTKIVTPEYRIANGKRYSPTHYDSNGKNLPPGPQRAKLRSKTYRGIAKAMAEQWT